MWIWRRLTRPSCLDAVREASVVPCSASERRAASTPPTSPQVDRMRSHVDRRSLAALAVGAALSVLAPVPPRRALAQAAAPSAEARLRERGIELPRVTAPVANYVPYVRTGNLVFLAGTGPTTPEGKFITGKVGKDTSVEEAYG